MTAFRFPKSDQRVAVVGHTGSGKTLMAAWLLSHSNIASRPWVVIDYKKDKFLNSLRNIRELSLRGDVPRKAGLYIAHPLPTDQDQVEDFLWKVWQRGKTGVYVDEGHMLPNKKAFQALLTQGRSKQIPMIVLTQRPVWTSRFVFSEADHVSAFHVQFPDDRRFMAGLMNSDIDERLPEYHSRWHDVANATTFRLHPVPPPDMLKENISSLLRPNTWWL